MHQQTEFQQEVELNLLVNIYEQVKFCIYPLHVRLYICVNQGHF